METKAMDFPLKPWEQMNEEEQKYFRKMSEKDVVRRWNSKQGEETKKKIVEVNLGRVDEF
jgi:hypothetical protein